MNKKKAKDEMEWVRFLGAETKRKFSFIVTSILFCVVLSFVAIFTTSGGSNSTYRPCGKIIVTSDSKNPNDVVSVTFGRSRYFLIYDLTTKKFKAIPNPYFNEMSPGISAARLITNRAEEAVITGNIGSAAFRTLDNFNVHVYLVHRTTARDAVRLFLEGKLIHVTANNTPMAGNGRPAWRQTPLRIAQPAAFGPAVGMGTGSQRVAVCPLCGLNMPLGAHIQTNKLMCPNCPGQEMQIISAEPRPQVQQAGFGVGNAIRKSFTSRGVCILK